MVIVNKNAVSSDTIDNWNKISQHIECELGETADPKDPGKFFYDKNLRSCESRMITFEKHRKLYLDILNNIYPYVDYHQFSFGVSLYKRLEVQHTTYYKSDHYVKHTDGNVIERKQLQRKISMVLMMSDKSEYTGGLLTISGRPIDMDKGTLVMFNPTAVHSVGEVVDGVRKTLVVWALGPHWT